MSDTASTTLKQIQEIFQSIVPGVDLTTLRNETVFDEFGIDSLDRTELFMELEEEFNIIIADDNKINTFGDLCQYIEKAIKND